MKNLKIVVLFLVMFILSGCAINYDVTINTDGSVDDMLQVEIPNQMTSLYFNTPREYLDYMYKAKTEEYNLLGYESDYEIGESLSKVKLTSSHKDFDDFMNSNIAKLLFTNVSVTKEGNKTIVALTGMKDIYNSVSDGDYYSFPKEFTITLNSRYLVEKDNADEKNVLTGVYKWHFKEGVITKSIKFTITDTKNPAASFFGDNPILSLVLMVLAIFAILFIIYELAMGKIRKVNSI